MPPKEQRKEDDVDSAMEEEEEEEDDKVGDEEEEAPAWAKQMNKNMGKLLKQMGNVNIKVDTAVNVAKEAKTAVTELQGDFKTLHEDYTNFKEGIGETVAASVKQEVERVMHGRSQNFGSGEGSDPDADHPERLIIVSGWPEGTPEKTIVDKLQAFITTNSLQSRVVQVFCYSDEAMSGVLKCRTEAGRNAILRSSMRLNNKEIDGDRTMKFSKKLSVQERSEEKRLGYIKHAVMTKLGLGVKEVKIKWPLRVIECKGETIFKVTKQGQRSYSGIGKEVSKEVEEKVQEWLKKRQYEDSD